MGGATQPLAQQVTCGSQAYFHTASLEFTAALMLRHNEVAAAMHAGYEGGKVTVLAAGRLSEGDVHVPVGVDSSLHDMDMRLVLLLQAQPLPTGRTTPVAVAITG